MKTQEFRGEMNVRREERNCFGYTRTSRASFAPLFLRYVLTPNVKGRNVANIESCLIKRGKQGCPCFQCATVTRKDILFSPTRETVAGCSCADFCVAQVSMKPNETSLTRSWQPASSFPIYPPVTPFRGSVCSSPMKSRKYANTGTKFRNYLNSATNKRFPRCFDTPARRPFSPSELNTANDRLQSRTYN